MPDNRPGLGIIVLLAMISALMTSVASADPQLQRINKVKASFVLNIARFVSWPVEAFDADDGDLQLCYYRSNPFADGLDSIRGKTVAGKPLKIRKAENLLAAATCHILLISQSELDNFTSEVKPGLSKPLLTIADMTNAKPGSVTTTAIDSVVINLVRKGQRIGFEVNLPLTRAIDLKMSSELLKHARIIGEAY